MTKSTKKHPPQTCSQRYVSITPLPLTSSPPVGCQASDEAESASGVDVAAVGLGGTEDDPAVAARAWESATRRANVDEDI